MILGRALAALIVVTPAFAQYAGPAILARGQAPAAMGAPAIDFRPFVDVTGIYDTGLSGVAVNSQGQLPNDKSYGVEISGGVSGVHSWKHTLLGLDYQASYRHYTQQSFYDGTNQSLLLGITHQLSRHTSLAVRESAGIANRNFGFLGLPQTVPFDPSTTYVPTSDFFDNRTIFVSTQADLTIQRSARLSFSLGGDGFLTRRRSTALYGVSGGGARGDMQYRMSRRSTIGVAYSFTHYAFRGIFSSTDMQGLVGTYGVALSRTLEFSGYGGIYRAETKFEQNVPVEPAIAALIGISQGTVVAYRINYVPDIGARLSQTLRHGVVFISGGHSIIPGNGLFLTSTSTSVGGGYAYTGLRRWSFNSGPGYTESRSIGNVIGNYSSYYGTISMSRQIARGTHLVINGQARKYGSGDFNNYNRWIYTLRIGLGFSPGDIPLRVW